MAVLGRREGFPRAQFPARNLPPRSRSSAILLYSLLVLVLFSGGCRKKQLTNADIRGITQEFVAAAQQVNGRKAPIAIRPELTPSSAGKSAPALTEDHVYVTLADPANLRALEAALDQVARRHHLVREARSSTPGLVRFDYLWGNLPTHSIHIISPLARLQPAAPVGTSARVAIIIDDLGYDSAAADDLLSMPFPLTLSVLPDLPHSTEIAEEATRRGYQVLLHLPMAPGEGEAKTEADELRPGMTSDEVARELAAMLDTVPGAVGVNNHQGSLATADPQLMGAVMPVLRQRGLFFIDSRTTVATVAYEVAERAGVRAAYRNVFLDDVPTPAAIGQELARAERLARRQGWSIAIGHPHPATLEALREDLPRLEARGVRLVFAADVVR